MNSIVATALAAALLAGCTTALPAIEAGPDPASPTARVAPSLYTPVTAGTTAFRPVEPGSWTERNEAVAPRRRN